MSDRLFTGFLARMQPFQLVSLSGGGYRAALYHAGVLRALREDGRLDPDARRLAIAAVSGGSIPALIWQTFLAADDPPADWPEHTILELVTCGPGFPPANPLLMKLMARRFRRRWKAWLDRWWASAIAKIKLEHALDFDRKALCMIEMLDFMNGEIWVHCNDRIVQPDAQLFKYGNTYHAMYPEGVPVGVPDAILHATSFPVIFQPWRFSIGRGEVTTQRLVGNYLLLDAGLVDNNAILPFFRLLMEDMWKSGAVQRDWLISDAGAPMALLDEPKNLFGDGRAADSLAFTDKAMRIAGDLGQYAAFRSFLVLAKGLGFAGNIVAQKIGNQPEQRVVAMGKATTEEAVWIASHTLTSASDIARYPTDLAPLGRRDALAIMAHGAQATSANLDMPENTRRRIRERLEALLPN